MKFRNMKKGVMAIIASVALCSCVEDKPIYKSAEFSWYGDRIIQGNFEAVAHSDKHITSNYNTAVEGKTDLNEWLAKNDFSNLPHYTAPSLMENAIYNMGLDEMVNAIEPDSTLRTGKEWAGVWTRDVSYSIILSMAHMQTEVSKISLMHKVNSRMRIIQDTGTGGAWPCSTDRIIWIAAAWEIYLVTGDREWIEMVYPIICNTLEDDRLTSFDENSGLYYGETSFVDWREQSYPRWMQPVDIYKSKAHGTNVVHAQALKITAKMAEMMGDNEKQERYSEWADDLTEAINEKFRLDNHAYSSSFLYGRTHDIAANRYETLGESLGIIWDITDKERQRDIIKDVPLTPFGVPVFFPFIKDMPAYHNNATWPFVASYYALANAKLGNNDGVLYSFATIYRAAAMYCTNKENYELVTGDWGLTEVNSDNMLWSLSGNIALTHKILFGMDFTEEGLRFNPMVPKEMGGTRRLANFKYRNAVLDITLDGYGNEIKSFTIDGIECEPVVAGNIGGEHTVTITLNNKKTGSIKESIVKKNFFAPATPAVVATDSSIVITCNNDADKYYVLVDGEPEMELNKTKEEMIEVLTCNERLDGEIQVVAFSKKCSYSFASEPIRNYTATDIYEIKNYYTPNYKNEIPGYAVSECVALENDINQVIEIPVTVDNDGKYAIDIRYSNGHGPINTENKCAIRSLSIDGNYTAAVVMPHRGTDNWTDWGWSNTIVCDITKGNHIIRIYFQSENHNMNIMINNALIDQLRIVKIKD